MLNTCTSAEATVNDNTSKTADTAANAYMVNRSRVHGGVSPVERKPTVLRSCSAVNDSIEGPPRSRSRRLTLERRCPRIVDRTPVDTISTTTIKTMMSRVTPRSSGYRRLP